jgi:hypothetical protein
MSAASSEAAPVLTISSSSARDASFQTSVVTPPRPRFARSVPASEAAPSGDRICHGLRDAASMSGLSTVVTSRKSPSPLRCEASASKAISNVGGALRSASGALPGRIGTVPILAPAIECSFPLS